MSIRFDDLHSVGEPYTENYFRQLVVAIEARKMKAIAALEHSKTARATLDTRESEITRELARLTGEIEAAAAHFIGQEMGELGREAAGLREELNEIGAKLLAARSYFGDLAKKL